MTKEQFIGYYTGWDSYKPLLWEALESTTGDVIELGIGRGSTEALHKYCESRNRKLFSYESNHEYFNEYKFLRSENHSIEYVGTNWQLMQEAHRNPIGVLFSDEAPGEMRKYNISMFCNLAQVIVAHDSEDYSDHGYKFSLVKPLFKFVKSVEEFRTGTTAFSNFIDVSKWNV
jgi:hypothetical protein